MLYGAVGFGRQVVSWNWPGHSRQDNEYAMNTDGGYADITPLFTAWVADPLDESIKPKLDAYSLEMFDGALAYFPPSCQGLPWYRLMQTYTDDRKEEERHKRTRKQRWTDRGIGAFIVLLLHIVWYFIKKYLEGR